eukprot:GILJ01005504.1.p1 GENE.GILJ01005504.1~~GILJ01005504.1.p1  ORF type:complete len:917 (-),score=93.02 GILJ01005504.1:89-2839(-)
MLLLHRANHCSTTKKIPKMADRIAKTFHLYRSPRCVLPAPDRLFSSSAFSVQRLMDEKRHLNTVKSKLDEKDIKLWGKHTNFTNRTGRVVQKLRYQIDAEMCTVAWAKFYEMVETYDLVPPSAIDARRLNSVHLCEAPGAFICSLNHYVRTKFENMEWDWLAISLNPYFEGNDLGAMIDDDRFISQTSDHWYFGVDNSGNILKQENVQGLWDTAMRRFDKVLLVTADGSVDCSTNPNEQESVVAALHYAELIAGLGILAKGGSFVLKLFTLFEHSTIGLLFLFACFFDDLKVCKPATSKDGNSETYVIAKGFKGWDTISKDYLSVLFRFVGKELPNKTLVGRNDIHEGFLEQVIDCAKQFSKWQIDTIEENIRLFDYCSSDTRRSIENEKHRFANDFARTFRIRRLDPQRRIVKNVGLDGRNLNTSFGGSGGDRRMKDSGTLSERINKKRTRDDVVNASNMEPEIHDPSRESDLERPARRQKIEDTRDSGPVYSAFAQRQMTKLGYQEGLGLGAQQQGIPNPITPQPLPFRSGLGFASQDASATTIYWLHNDNAPMLSLKPDHKIVIGPSIVKLQMSKFCSWNAMLALQDARNGCTEDMFSRYSCAFPAGVAFVGDVSSTFASREAVEFADLDHTLSIVPHAPVDKFTFIDLSGGPGGNADYILWRANSNVVGLGITGSDMCEYTDKFASLPSFHVQSLLSSAAHLDYSDEVKQIARSRFERPVSLVVGDVLHQSVSHVDRSQVDAKFILWNQCVAAWSTLDSGGSFVCRVSDTINRFTAGVLYLLHRSFRNISIVKPRTLPAWANHRMIVCRGKLANDPEFLDFLSAISNQLREYQATAVADTDVLEIVPMTYLLSGDFPAYLTDMNDKLCERQTAALRRIKELHAQHTVVAESDVLLLHQQLMAELELSVRNQS